MPASPCSPIASHSAVLRWRAASGRISRSSSSRCSTSTTWRSSSVLATSSATAGRASASHLVSAGPSRSIRVSTRRCWASILRTRSPEGVARSRRVGQSSSSSLVWCRWRPVEHQAHVAAQDARSRRVTGVDRPDQARGQGELTAEGPVHHDHVPDVGERGGQWVRRGSSWVQRRHGRGDGPPTRHPHHLHIRSPQDASQEWDGPRARPRSPRDAAPAQGQDDQRPRRPRRTSADLHVLAAARARRRDVTRAVVQRRDAADAGVEPQVAAVDPARQRAARPRRCDGDRTRPPRRPAGAPASSRPLRELAARPGHHRPVLAQPRVLGLASATASSKRGAGRPRLLAEQHAVAGPRRPAGRGRCSPSRRPSPCRSRARRAASARRTAGPTSRVAVGLQRRAAPRCTGRNASNAL